MEFLQSRKLLTVFTFLILVTAIPAVIPTVAQTLSGDLLELFPEHIGPFKRLNKPVSADLQKEQTTPNQSIEPSSDLSGTTTYSENGREKLLVEISRFHQDGQAYSAVTQLASKARERQAELELSGDYGTAGFVDSNEIVFFKGVHLVRISNGAKDSAAANLARGLSDRIDKGEGEIPALVKHLPNWEDLQKRVLFLTRFSEVQSLAPQQTVLSVLDTGGDADATFVDAGSGKILIVEYNTPQLAKDNDEKIVAKIHELWRLGQPAPIGYRRVGNYSVFVFDSPNEAIAKQLIDQVKYDHVVQWLGNNPNILREAERRYVETTLGVFIAVLKASGFALVACVGLGALIGTFLFSRRRAQQRTQEAFSDAGGMLRLNIDELTPQADPGRLIGPGR